jgi:lysophospholipase L1-like esterase
VVIVDEDLTNLGGLGLPSFRQATANDLVVLPAAGFIGTLADPNNPLSVNGVAIPLADQWVLTPNEQQLVATATQNFNTTISNIAQQNGLALVDANTLLIQLSEGGIESGNFILNASLVTGGAFSLDGVHPNSRGYALIANEFMKAIDVAYGSNFEDSGNLVNVGDFPTNYSPLLQ